MKDKPLLIDLYSGLHGWAIPFVQEGYRVKAFDLFDMHKELGIEYERPPEIELFLRDVREIHGSEFADAACIVASPPCQKYSYMAMPWSRAKKLAEWYRQSQERIDQLNELFNACFRIQREASEAAGRYIPLIVENVKGAQPWVGRAAWHCGPFYLFGDVPAVMPLGKWQKGEGSGRSWFYQNGGNARSASSQSKERKQWQAQVAKIPSDIARHIAQCFKPISSPVCQPERSISA